MRPLFDIVSWRAARQHGRVTWEQLLADGVDRDRIKRWIADGRLRPVHRGVYAVGHTARSGRAELMAAVLACGEGAVVSHQSAAHLLALTRSRPARPHITVPTTAGRKRPGIVIHRVTTLHALDATTWHGIPTTTVPRVLLDLAPTRAPPDLTRLCHEAWIHHDTTPTHVEACIARNPRKPGIATLRRAIGTDVTLSELEDGFLDLLSRHDLARPRTNIDHRGDKVDCHWPEHNLTIELVSYRYHATRHAFETGIARRRRSHHTAYTWGDIFERGADTAAQLKRALA
ncbi:MAG: type IV toxin-antitoxin system AbiEi family antitoxin domain-containing protein [Solirubrobacteraceae bacterium]